MAKLKATKEKPIKAYKALDKDFKCRGFQYEIGKEYHTANACICDSGFHVCRNPFDCLNYYSPVDCRFAVVDVWGDGEDHNEDSKLCFTDIRIVRELTLHEYNIMVLDYLIKDAENSNKEKASGNSSQLAASGNSSKLAASGNSSQLAASGSSSQLAASGNYSKLAASGYSSKLAASGYSSQLAASGYSSQLAASGDSSQLAASGDSSKLAASGYSSKLEITGTNGVAANIGIGGRVKGIKGTWITLAEYNDKGKCVLVKSTKIDGVDIEENVYYTLKNGNFVKI